MNALTDSLMMTVPLSYSMHEQAELFSQKHSNQRIAQQVYLNTLGVSAVRFYLQCMGITTNLITSASWNPVLQALMDVADLDIPGCGKIECRPVLHDATSLYIPSEVWTERIGYVAVQFDAVMKTAMLLGFVPMVTSEELALDQLQPLDKLLQILHKLQTRITLNQWLKGIFTLGWQTLDELMGDRPRLVLSLRSEVANAEQTVKRAKLLDFGLQIQHQPLTLLIAVTPTTEESLSVSVQLHPTMGEVYLPEAVSLSLVVDANQVLQTVRSRTQDNYIQLKRFSGKIGSSFDLQITLGNEQLTESFVL